MDGHVYRAKLPELEKISFALPEPALTGRSVALNQRVQRQEAAPSGSEENGGTAGSGYWSGYYECLVNAMHITASVLINNDEDGLERLAPHAPTEQYLHNRTGEDNADAHLKRQVMGREVVVAVTEGKLDFGPWEQIFYGEFDGGRRKRVLVKVIGE